MIIVNSYFMNHVECFTEDKPSGYDPPYETCSLLVAEFPRECNTNTNVRNRCCYWCKKLGYMAGESKSLSFFLIIDVHYFFILIPVISYL